jgi:hypothetical protein
MSSMKQLNTVLCFRRQVCRQETGRLKIPNQTNKFTLNVLAATHLRSKMSRGLCR